MPNLHLRAWFSAMSIAVVLGSAGLAEARRIVELTDCDDYVGPGEIGVLQNDIVCEADDIYLSRNARLDLAGFTVTKIENTAIDQPGWDEESPIYCSHKCEIYSTSPNPGRIVGPGRGTTDVVVAIEGGDYYDATYCRRIRVTNVEISSFDQGIDARDARGTIKNVTVSDTGLGIGTLRLKAEHVVATDNDTGIAAGLMKLNTVTVTGSSNKGISAGGLRAKAISVSGNEFGVFALRTRIQDSDVTGNVTDVASFNAPKMKDTTCDTSMILAGGFPFVTPDTWGVCASD